MMMARAYYPGQEIVRLSCRDVATGTKIRELVGHGNTVRSVAFLPDGRHALTGEDLLQLQGEVILWDLESGEIVNRFGKELAEVIEGVLSIAVSPDGRTALVSYGRNSSFDTESAALWNIESGEVIYFLPGTEQSVDSVAISRDGRLGFGAASDGNVYVWDLTTGELRQTLRGHEGIVTKVALSADGLSVLSGALDGTMILWDLATGQPIEIFKDHHDAVWGIGFQDNGHAVSGSADGTLRQWNLDGNWHLAEWRDSDQPADYVIQELAISPDGQTVLTESWQRGTGADPALTLWDYETGTPIDIWDPWKVGSTILPLLPIVNERLRYIMMEHCRCGIWLPEKGWDISAATGIYLWHRYYQ